MKLSKKTKRKKISTILPLDLLNEAVELSGINQTDTITKALQELVRSYKRSTVLNLRGKLDVDFDIARDRERTRF